MKQLSMRAFLTFLSLVLALSFAVSCGKEPAVTKTDVTKTDVTKTEVAVSSTVSEVKAESKPASSVVSSAVKKPQTTTVTGTAGGKGPNYNTNLNIEDNVFMDALIYTGYNMKKHRADGNMWVYILSEYKRGLGYLSNITYGGGSSGLETTADGLPDIKAFERGGLVCASFATYVYFNYLPNVAGIDTSSLTRPERTYNAHSFYTAAKDWIKKGYSYSIPFTASRTSSGYIVFNPKEEIPIGSIIVFEDDRKHDGRGSHIVVYGGYKNGHHWVYQVGTSNGPEMCAVERMLFGPDPQWPLMIISAPSNIRMSAMAEIQLQDEEGAPLAGASFKLINRETGKTVLSGKTDKNGRLSKEGLAYGKYTLTQTALPQGYTCDKTSQTVELTPHNNSKNTIKVVNQKIVVPESTVTPTVT